MFFKRYIVFTLLYNKETYSVKTFEGEYEDLRLLIIDHVHPANFGRCDGMGRCATCMVTLSIQNQIQKPEICLSCQLTITDELANKVISILPEVV
jgi:2Fe-2S ferredoxin